MTKTQKNICIQNFFGYFNDCDIVIIEGLKDSDFHKIEVVIEKSTSNNHNLIAIVTDGDFIHPDVPTFKRNDILSIVNLMKKHFQAL